MIYIHSDSIISPLGCSTAENFQHLRLGVSGIRWQDGPALAPQPFWAARMEDSRLDAALPTRWHHLTLTRIEKMLLCAAQQAIQASHINGSEPETVFVLSTTKGNIELLKGVQPPVSDDNLVARATLGGLAGFISRSFDNPNAAVVVCNACISGVVAMEVAMRLLRMGKYRHAVVVAGDVLSEYVVSGFQSFKAMSDNPCRPYDKDRNGINLGEGAAAMVLSTDPPQHFPTVILEGAACSNDANHISGPSRTGDGLYLAIQNALKDAQCTAQNLDYLCMHGTATVYNDEMESKALALAGLTHVPMHSLKGFFGHTLGAAGLIESVIAAESMRHSFLIQSLGFESVGTPEKLHIITQNSHQSIHRCLKTASGFGGCNAAAVLSLKNA